MKTQKIYNNFPIKILGNTFKDMSIIKAIVVEKISNLFEIELFLQAKKNIDISKTINDQVTISFEYLGKKFKYFTGIIQYASYENVPSPIQSNINNIIILRIAPSFSKLQHTNKHRTFKNMSVLEVVKSILKDGGISNIEVSSRSFGNKKKPFIVQYEESDLCFISRILEEEGMFYFFRYEQNKDILCISDNSVSSRKIPGVLRVLKSKVAALTDVNTAYNISMSRSVGFQKTESFFYNETKAEIVKGGVSAQSDKSKIGTYEVYNHIFKEKPDGDNVSKINLERLNSESIVLRGESYYPEIIPGQIIKFTGSATPEVNNEFFITEARHIINQIIDDGEDSVYVNSFIAIPANIPFRPKISHTRPKMTGTYTAKVIGPDKEEVHCNEHGMVLVKFPWGESTWTRVAQAWAGNGFGALFIPRIGMEVLVSFINGNPDEPLIIGAVYNGINKPPANYPKEKNSVTTIYTKTIKSKGYNELRFNDKAREEEIFIHAQRDMTSIVEENLTQTINIGSKRTTLESQKDPVENLLTIKKGVNKVIINDGDYSVTLDKGNHYLTIQDGNKTITMKKGNLKIAVEGDIEISANNIKVTANGEFSLSSSKNTKIDSGGGLHFHAKQSVKMDGLDVSISAKTSIKNEAADMMLDAKAGVSVNGMKVSVKGTGSVDIKSSAILSIQAGATGKITANGALNIKGGGMLALGGAIITLG